MGFGLDRGWDHEGQYGGDGLKSGHYWGRERGHGGVMGSKSNIFYQKYCSWKYINLHVAKIIKMRSIPLI